MNVLYIAAYYYPENIAYTHLQQDIIASLLRAGNCVTVVCPTPTRGISDEVFSEYKRNRYQEMDGGNLKVYRFGMFRESHNKLLRAIRYVLCSVKSYFAAIKFGGTDVIFAVSTPPTQGMLSGMVKKKLKCKFAYNVQDIFPEAAANIGYIKSNSLLYKLGLRIVEKTYKCADEIVVISNDFKNNLVSHNVPEEKINVINNWVDTDAINYIDKANNTLFDELEINRDKFIVLYAGNLGYAQNIEIIIDAAKQLSDEKEIEFIIIGGGSREEGLKKYAHGVKNIHFYPLQPMDRTAEVYSMGDICLMSCKAGTGGIGVPSKTWSILSCRRPIIASFDDNSEIIKIILQNEMGLSNSPTDIHGLADNIMQLYSDGELRAKMGRCGRNYVEHAASAKECPQRYVECMMKTTKNEKRK